MEQSFQNWLSRKLQSLEEKRLARRSRPFPSGMANFASNDYLALSTHPAVIERASRCLSERGLGSCSARLLSGTTESHAMLERELAEFLRAEDCLLTSSGYLANVGLLASVAGKGDAVVADRAVHASLVDGIRQSGARLLRFAHNDPADAADCLRRARGEGCSKLFLVTETVFSMDGDIAPVPALLESARAYSAVPILDEAHALGVFGGGRGLAWSYPDAIRTGTLSKAFGAYGGFIAGARELRPVLESVMRPYIFNTSPPPAIAEGALASLEIIRTQPALGEELLRRSNAFRAALARGGVNTSGSESQIVPAIIPGAERALRVAGALESRNILAPAIRPPTVPAGAERLRFSVTLHHTEDDLTSAATTLRDVLEANR